MPPLIDVSRGNSNVAYSTLKNIGTTALNIVSGKWGGHIVSRRGTSAISKEDGYSLSVRASIDILQKEIQQKQEHLTEQKENYKIGKTKFMDGMKAVDENGDFHLDVINYLEQIEDLWGETIKIQNIELRDDVRQTLKSKFEILTRIDKTLVEYTKKTDNVRAILDPIHKKWTEFERAAKAASEGVEEAPTSQHEAFMLKFNFDKRLAAAEKAELAYKESVDSALKVNRGLIYAVDSCAEQTINLRGTLASKYNKELIDTYECITAVKNYLKAVTLAA